MPCRTPLSVLLLHAVLAITSAQDEVIVDSGDLAVGRVFTASSTCGLDGPEEYCQLVDPSSNTTNSRQCFICDASDPENAHTVNNLNDVDSSAMADRTWWQARNGESNVTLDLDLGSLFFFTHLVITFRSPKPAAAVIERSRDFGQTYEPYQFYSSDCRGDFGMDDRSSIRTVDEVICTSEYSSIEPLTNGELIYRAIPPSLGIMDYNDPAVTNKITLTNLRVRLLRLNTFPGDDLSDSDTVKSYQYAIYSVVVRGWCFCNGHALECDPPPGVLDPEPGMVNSQCRCVHGTQGENCEVCQPLFNNRPWLPANGPNQTSDPARHCQECQCYGRASSCHFDPLVAMETPGSGGVCDNCTHNTRGNSCEQCVAGFYRNTSALLSDPDVCLSCDCEFAGSENGGVCSPDDDQNDPLIVSGMCFCRSNVEGDRCDQCKPGNYNLTASNPAGCQFCDCDPVGSESTECDVGTGQCMCKSNVTGRRCDQCEPEHCCLTAEGCSPCGCDIGGSSSLDCHPTSGRCSCRDGVTGERCDSLAEDHFIFTHLPLNEATQLALGGQYALWVKIHPEDFRNVSTVTFALLFTSSNHPAPDPALCPESGSQATTGSIPFQEAVIVQDMESGQYYLQVLPAFCWMDGVSIPYRLAINTELQPPENVIISALPSAARLLPSPPPDLEGCYQIPAPSGGPSPECRAAIFSTTALLANGTPACGCDELGSFSSSCEELNGQCPCRPGVEGWSCDRCREGYFGLGPDGCQDCNCYPQGSLSTTCNATTGQCPCQEGFGGRECDMCAPDHYFVPGTGCVPCNCNEEGSTSLQCGRDGQCDCKPDVRGVQCDRCRPDHYDFSSAGCTPCDCDPEGSERADVCDAAMGQCPCLDGVSGRQCNMCPSFSLGPSRNTVTACVDCFCNGYSRQCASEDGWFQAEVSSGLGPGGQLEGFRTNGRIISTQGQLEVDPGSLSSLSISLPKAFLGDKRTAYSQHLTFNLSIPDMVPGDSCHVFVEVVGRLSRYRQVKLVAELPVPESEPTVIEVPLVPGDFQVDVWFWRRPASPTDIRQILANIRQLRLKVIFDEGTTPKTVLLHSISLGYATSTLTDPFTISPLRNVSYVEQCVCPPNRMGPRCEICSPGYTTDPAYGGEFARCVRCYCNFHSQSCDPVTGVCFNCTDNTAGDDCEGCVEGYYRNTSLNTDGCVMCDCFPEGTVGNTCSIDSGRCVCKEGYGGQRCDLCEDGFWRPSTGVCRPCNCHPEGSSSSVCGKTTGVCPCLPGIAGPQCDQCPQNTTGLFPTCEVCDECTGQWQRRIGPLREDINSTLELVRMLNVTVGPEDIPLLAELLRLLQEIQDLLHSSRIDPELSGNVTALHIRLCELTNRTEELIQRAAFVLYELTRLGSEFDIFNNETAQLSTLLMQLRVELDFLTEAFGNITLFDPSAQLELARAALERSDRADRLISTNVTSLVSLTEGILAEYNRKLAQSSFLARQMENMRRLSDLSQRLREFEAFLVRANMMLCGASGNDTSVCGECGGLECGVCGGPGCRSLVSEVAVALNISERALQLAQDARMQIESQVALLRELLSEALVLRNESEVAEVVARETAERAEEILRVILALLEEVRGELGGRLDLERITEVEQQTLSLQLVVTTDEFFEILVTINATIDALFEQFGVNATGLRRRAEVALSRAQAANGLAAQIVANASQLEALLRQLVADQERLRGDLEDTESRNLDTRLSVNQTELILDQVEDTLNSTQRQLDALTRRLADLQLLAQQNLRDLEAARNATREAEMESISVRNNSIELEEDFNELQALTVQKLRVSEMQLLMAQDLRNRTVALEQRTSQQLLLVENLDRTKTALIIEQEIIRGDIQRLAIQLEDLYEQIQVHIARNTACLDTGTLQKR